MMRRSLLILFLSLLATFAIVPAAFAHDHEAAPIAGPLAWALMAFGILVIAVVGIVLFVRQPATRHVSAAEFEMLTFGMEILDPGNAVRRWVSSTPWRVPSAAQQPIWGRA